VRGWAAAGWNEPLIFFPLRLLSFTKAQTENLQPVALGSPQMQVDRMSMYPCFSAGPVCGTIDSSVFIRYGSATLGRWKVPALAAYSLNWK
jgi:hypothetical protein